MEFSVFLAGTVFPALRTISREAERLGFTAVWHEDNVYPHPDEVRDRDMPILDCWTTLAALAVSTSTIRLGSMVTPAPRRHPALLAKAISTLDVISGGRVTVGIGGGDPTTVRQYAQWGMPFPVEGRERLALLEEHLEVQRLLYTEARASFEGRFFRLDDAVNSPKPVQKPHPPIWIGLNARVKAMPRIAARHADGIVVQWGDDRVAARAVPALEAACGEIGRSVSGIRRARLCVVVLTDGSWSRERAFTEIGRAWGVLRPEGTYEAVDLWDCVLFGTPDEVCEQLASRVDALGFDHAMCGFFGFGLEVDTGGLDDGFGGRAIAGMRAFAEHVMPRFGG